MAQLGKARAWNLVAYASKLVALCASGVQISPSAPFALVARMVPDAYPLAVGKPKGRPNRGRTETLETDRYEPSK